MSGNYKVKDGFHSNLFSKGLNLWQKSHREAKAKMILAVLKEELGKKSEVCIVP